VVLLDDLQASRGRLLASFFDAVVESNPKQSALSGEIRDRLRDLSGQILKTVSASDLSMWLASLCLNRWLGEAPADRTSARLLHSDMRSWAQNDVITAAKIFRLESDCDGVLSCLCVAFGKSHLAHALVADLSVRHSTGASASGYERGRSFFSSTIGFERLTILRNDIVLIGCDYGHSRFRP